MKIGRLSGEWEVRAGNKIGGKKGEKKKDWAGLTEYKMGRIKLRIAHMKYCTLRSELAHLIVGSVSLIRINS